MKNSAESGFTLIELAVVILIVGLITAGTMLAIQPAINNARYNTTKTRLDNLSLAFASYAQNYGRLPCPAITNPTTEPYGAPNNSGAAGLLGTGLTDDCTGGAGGYMGIVPFRALGLEEDAGRDGFGNLITYMVTPAMAGRGPNQNLVHEQCRTPVWIEGGQNRNTVKAHLCCAANSNLADLTVIDHTTNNMFSGQHSATANRYDDPDTAFNRPPATVPEISNRFVAFALLSHGRNGDGAYIKNSAATNPVTVGGTPPEAENRNGDFTLRADELAENDPASYYDDILVWRTNEQLVSAFGDAGCAKP